MAGTAVAAGAQAWIARSEAKLDELRKPAPLTGRRKEYMESLQDKRGALIGAQAAAAPGIPAEPVIDETTDAVKEQTKAVDEETEALNRQREAQERLMQWQRQWGDYVEGHAARLDLLRAMNEDTAEAQKGMAQALLAQADAFWKVGQESEAMRAAAEAFRMLNNETERGQDLMQNYVRTITGGGRNISPLVELAKRESGKGRRTIEVRISGNDSMVSDMVAESMSREIEAAVRGLAA